MTRPRLEMLIPDDRRAVAPVIAVVLLLGIGFVAFSSFQATVVPQQNAAAEFEHLQTVENDLIEVQQAILRAGQTNIQEFATVQLGTTYPTRLVGLNPPPPAGSLQTSEPYNITITNEADGTTVNITTRFLEYEPGYNELPAEAVIYENTVLYRQGEDGVATLEDQELAPGANTLEITALQNEFREQGTERTTVSLFPTPSVTAGGIPEGNLTVTLPTQLDAAFWEAEQDLNEVPLYQGIDTGENQYPDDVNALEFNLNTSDDDELRLNTVGIQSEPDEAQTDPIKRGVGFSPQAPIEGANNFDSLLSSGRNNLNNIDTSWEITDSSGADEVRVTVINPDGESDEETVPAENGEVEGIGDGGNPDSVDVVVEALSDGDVIEECEGTLESEDESLTLADGFSCEPVDDVDDVDDN